MIRGPRFLILFLLVSFASAQEEIPWLSPSRLSVSLLAGYHYAPWTSYNHAMQVAQQYINADPTYVNPRGSFEKVNGDVSFDGIVSYRVIRQLSVYGILSHTTTGGRMSLQTSSGMIERAEQDIDLGVFEYGLGLNVGHDFGEAIRFWASGSYSWARGTLSYEFATLQYGFRQLSWSAEFTNNTNSWRLNLGATAIVAGPVAIQFSTEYRWLRFDTFEGTADERYADQANPGNPYEYKGTFHTYLAEKSNYFGLNERGSQVNPTDFYWANTPYDAAFPQPAVFDLSGFGVKGGIVIEF